MLEWLFGSKEKNRERTPGLFERLYSGVKEIFGGTLQKKFDAFVTDTLGPILRALDIDIEGITDSATEANEPVTKKNTSADRRRREVFGTKEKRYGKYGEIETNLAHAEDHLSVLADSLRAAGKSEAFITEMLAKQKLIYRNMYGHLGTWYEDKVQIRSVNGHEWKIKNSCTGNAMKVAEGLGFKVFNAPKNLSLSRGRGKYMSSFVWSVNEHWLKAVAGDKVRKIKGMRPESVDEQLKEYLQPGEAAAGLLWNHSIWVYRDPVTDVIMIHHSGADVRLQKITLEPGQKPPSGYDVSVDGRVATRRAGSKVNVLPFSEFLAKKAKIYGGSGKDWLEFVPVSDLVELHLADSDSESDSNLYG